MTLRLLIDTDAFCKLASADLLEESFQLLGIPSGECARLPALLPMLTRGSLNKRYGDVVCQSLRQIAASMPVVPESSEEWIDILRGVDSIDAGEVLLLAFAAESRIPLISGDKRAIIAAARIPALRERLDGLVISVEALLLALSRRLGDNAIWSKGSVMARHDRMAAAVFASRTTPLCESLGSYLASLEREVQPMQLWKYA